MKPLGRRVPTDFRHVERYPLRLAGLPVPPAGEKSLGLPWWWKQHDQGSEGSCVGFGCSAERSITNHYQRLRQTGSDATYRYAARWLYGEAQAVDEWPDTPPGEGTSVRAGYEVLVMKGHRRVQRGVVGAPTYEHGVTTYLWARTVDEVRAAIHAGLAVAIGVNWYTSFDVPTMIDGELWIDLGVNAHIRGGHCTTLYRYSDRREAVRQMNSWGDAYPPVWIPYRVLERLMNEYGEVAVVTDR